MRLLIDTQVFIWLINADERIGDKTYELLNDSSNEVNLSYFSLFEMKIKATVGKLTYEDSVVDDLPKMGIDLMMPTTEALAKYNIPNDANKDPFDNILIATARSEKCIFITSDPKILGLSMKDLRLQEAQK
jgi:PIN domain nuclease of toxin-antitoxin system